MMRTVYMSLIALALAIPSAYAAGGTGVEEGIRDANTDLRAKADEIRGQEIPQVVGKVQAMSNTVDDLYVLLRQKYAEGNNGGVVPERQNQLPQDFGQ
ncbi:MAG: hypothetical protein GC134_06525 [Proteobacteria bacterium]|nr:hypothetical protein [Pseudomonadota bacterium]